MISTLAVILVILKQAKIINWPWWKVLSPIWVTALIDIALFILVLSLI